MAVEYTVGLRLRAHFEVLTIEAEDALIAALEKDEKRLIPQRATLSPRQEIQIVPTLRGATENSPEGNFTTSSGINR